jgi:hypothetical protein
MLHFNCVINVCYAILPYIQVVCKVCYWNWWQGKIFPLSWKVKSIVSLGDSEGTFLEFYIKIIYVYVSISMTHCMLYVTYRDIYYILLSLFVINATDTCGTDNEDFRLTYWVEGDEIKCTIM